MFGKCCKDYLNFQKSILCIYLYAVLLGNKRHLFSHMLCKECLSWQKLTMNHTKLMPVEFGK